MSLRVYFALTSHGLGHLTRSLSVCDALRGLLPGLEPIVGTVVPEGRVARDLPGPFVYRPVDYEPGTLQRSCFELDVEGTRRAYAALLASREERLARELDFLRGAGVAAVLSDIPALPIRAAAELGIPAIGLANFTWDWILEPLLGGTELAGVPGLLASDYARGSLQLCLPFGPEGSPFPAREPAPLVSRLARLEPAQVRARLGLPAAEETPLVLVCPGGWDASGWSRIAIRGCGGLRFVTVGDLPIRSEEAPVHALPHTLPEGVAFPDLVQAASVVLAKPGYGIASECAVHGTGLVAIERPGFRETPVLLEGFRALGRLGRLSLDDFFAGRWQPALDAALASGASPRRVPTDGSARVARRIAELLETRAWAVN